MQMLFALMNAFDILMGWKTCVFQELFCALYKVEDFKIKQFTSSFPDFPGLGLHGGWITLKGTVYIPKGRQCYWIWNWQVLVYFLITELPWKRVVVSLPSLSYLFLFYYFLKVLQNESTLFLTRVSFGMLWFGFKRETGSEILNAKYEGVFCLFVLSQENSIYICPLFRCIYFRLI